MKDLLQKLLSRLKDFWETLKGKFPLPEKLLPKKHPQALKLYMLPAHNGDCLLIEFLGEDGKSHYIWTDGGLVKSYREFGKAVAGQLIQQGAQIDLMIVTHVDQDHIGGILALCDDDDIPQNWIKQFWFNSGELLSAMFNETPGSNRGISLAELEETTTTRSIRQGIRLEDYLRNGTPWHALPIKRYHTHAISGAEISVLTPSTSALRRLHREWQKETSLERSLDPNDYSLSLEALFRRPERSDASLANGSSISYVFEYYDKRILMLGDAWAVDVVEALQTLGYSAEEPLQLDAVKLSHHASRASISADLLDRIDCDTYLVSTDGSRHQLPHKETFARILLHPKRDNTREIQFIFNYNNPTLRKIFQEEEILRHHFRCIFPAEGSQGYVLEI